MNKNVRVFLIIFGIVIGITPTIIFGIFSENIVIGEQLCVDGNYNINLEGLMCEKTESFSFGYNFNQSSIIIIPSMIIGIMIYAISLFAKCDLPEGDGKE